MKLKHFVKENSGVTKDYHQIDPRLLQIRTDFNLRDLTTPAAREKLDILKAQIKAEGVLEPLEIAFDGETPWINEGHRRHIVVMELIAEGEAFKTIPCVQERLNIKDDKRTLHMLMRKKEEYEPLEYAKGLQRMVDVFGWDTGSLAVSLGEHKATIDRHLEMLGMTDEVKEQVASGMTSATLALKVTRDTRDAKTDPKFAAEILAAAAAEQKALGKKSRATPKAVQRVSDRAKPKTVSDPKPPAETTDTNGHELSDKTRAAIETAAAAMRDQLASALAAPQETEPHPQLQTAAEREQPRSMTTVLKEVEAIVPPARSFPPEALQPPTPARDIDRAMFAIIGELAAIGEGQDLNERDDNDKIEVTAGIIKRADRIYRQRIGDTSAEEAA